MKLAFTIFTENMEDCSAPSPATEKTEQQRKDVAKIQAGNRSRTAAVRHQRK